MKTRYIILSILSVALLSACNEKLLDIPQQGVISESNFYQTDDDAEQAIATCYQWWRNMESGAFLGGVHYANGFMMRNLLSDELNTGGSRSDQPMLQEFNESAISVTNAVVKGYFQDLYKLIYKAHLVMEHFDPESATKKRAIAEAHFFRAWAYLQLVTLWGTPPYIDHSVEPDKGDLENGDPALIWKLIEDDMEAAINSGALGTKSNVDDQEGGIRLTKEAAEAFYGRALLYEGKFAEAKAQLKKVIDSKKYALVPPEKFVYFYHTTNNHCSEYVLEINRHYDMANNSWFSLNGTMTTGQSGWFAILWNWGFNYGVCGGPDAASHFDFNATTGYSNGLVSKSLYDDYKAAGEENGIRRKATILSLQDLIDMNIYFDRTMSMYMNEGYWRFKWLPLLQDENVNYWGGSLACTPMIRYADVLLMMAEACVQTGESGDTYFNEVRTRAGVPTKSGVTLQDIKTERHLELALEGLRFQDLIRWGDAPTVLKDKGKRLPTLRLIPPEGLDITSAEAIYAAKYQTSVEYVDNDKPLAGWTAGRDELLPFPQAELDVNPNLRQNPGYSD